MTLEQAVEILNREKHQGHSEWVAEGDYATDDPCDDPVAFNTFEAVAIAEKYERERKPESRVTTPEHDAQGRVKRTP